MSMNVASYQREHPTDAAGIGAVPSRPAVDSTPVDHLAELTRHRDRDLLDSTLVVAFRDLLRPRSVAVYRMVGEAGSERWITRARLALRDIVASADTTTALSALPALAEHPARCEALSGGTVVFSRAGINVTVFPLMTDREVVGVLEVETDTALEPRMQHTVSSILRVYNNFESLLDCSERDTLTGLLNRRTFDETFLKILAAAGSAKPVVDGRRLTRADYPHWVGMVDIDFFKSVNDNFGHLIGDEVLLLQSRLMSSSFRYYDRLYRFGGEEFVVLLRCPDEATTAKVFERLRNNTASFLFPQVGHVTISVGFAEVKPGDSPSSALGRADLAVYYAKSHGRNQVHGYADLVSRGEIAAATTKTGEVDLF